MQNIQQLIAQAESGDVTPLADLLRDKPMGMSFKNSMDGEPDNFEWLEVESAVMNGDMSEATYDALRAAVGR